jgi:alcohol dehydrogenase class IV
MRAEDIAEFVFPGRLVNVAGASALVGEMLLDASAPPGEVLVVADRVVHEQGLTTALLEGLAAAGYQPRLFAEIAGEPDLAMVERAVAAADPTGTVAVVGVGGGSALDTAKLAAYLGANGGPLSRLSGPVPSLPGFPLLAMVPTTVGTGAEATRVAMVHVAGAKRAVLCRQFVPAIAVLDPDLVAGLPAPVVAATALDALSHAVESMLSTTSNTLTWTFSGEAARRVFARLPAAFAGDTSARGDLLYASFLAGVSLNAGVVLGHSLSYVLAARHDLPHGVGCALALPYCLAYNQQVDPQRASELAGSALGAPGATLRDLAEAAQALSLEVGIRAEHVGVDFGVEEAAALAERVVTDYPRPTNPVPLERARLTTLLTHLRAGDLPGAWTAMGATG